MNKKTIILIGLVLAFTLTLCYATTFSYIMDTTSPSGSDAPSTIDDQIRNSKLAWQERLNVDHLMALTGSQLSDADTGMHRQVTFYSDTSTDPILGVTAVDGIDELRYMNSDSTTFYLTSAGTLNITSADLLGTLANNTYFTAVDNAGTGTVDLIKADASDVAVLPDGSELATTAAPTADADIANKKYIDDQWSPTAYTGGETSTLGNGLVIKMGSSVLTTGSTVTFGTAFSTGIVSVTANMSSVTTTMNCTVTNLATTGFKVYHNGGTDTVYWIVIGY